MLCYGLCYYGDCKGEAVRVHVCLQFVFTVKQSPRKGRKREDKMKFEIEFVDLVIASLLVAAYFGVWEIVHAL